MKPKTRRRWRRIYRRSRVYIPIVVLLLLAMAFFLPLSPRWLANVIEKRLGEQLGVSVTLDRARVQLSQGSLDLYGLSVPAEAGGEPFFVGHLSLRGSVRELLAGDGHYPNEVTVTDPPVIRLRQTPEGLRPDGALETLLARLESRALRDRTRPPPTGSRPDAAQQLAARHTPEIYIRNLTLSAEAPAAALPPLTVTLHNVMMAARPEPGDPVVVRYNGIVTLGSSEAIRGQLHYLPHHGVFRGNASVTGIRGDFRIPAFGELYTEGRDLEIEASANRLEDGAYDLAAQVHVGRFELQESRVGGERWVDRDVEMKARGRLSPDTMLIEKVSAALSSNEVDLRAEGELRPVGDFPGRVRLLVERLPVSVLTLARREVAQQGLSIDPMTSPTLRLDVEAIGPFLQPAQLHYEGTVAVGGWRVSQPAWQYPLEIHRINGTLSNEALELPVLEVSMAGLEGSGRSRVPIPAPGERAEAQVDLSLRGSPEGALAMAIRWGVLPRVLEQATMPLALQMTARIPVERAPDTDAVVLLVPEAAYSGTLSWDQGLLSLSEWPWPIEVAAGRATFTERRVSGERVRATSGDLALTADLRAWSEERPLWEERPRFELRATAAGQVPAVIDFAARHALLPLAVRTALGNFQLDLQAEGQWDEWEQAAYTGALVLREGSAVIDQPLYPIRLDRLHLEAALSPEEIVLTRYSGRVEEAGVVSGSGRVTADAITVDAEIESPLWVVTHLIPRDTHDLVFDGQARARGRAQLLAHEPLPPAPDVARRWIEALAGQDRKPIGFTAEAPVQLDIDARIFPGEGATVFYRDFPRRVADVRGDITADQTGFYFNDVLSTWGEAQNVRVRGYVRLGHMGGPVQILFDADAPELNLNDWTEDWGRQPWAERPYVGPRRSGTRGDRDFEETEPQVVVMGTLRLGRTQFLSIRAGEAVGTLFLESWRRKPTTLDVALSRSTVYGGEVNGVASFLLGERDMLPRYTTSLYAERVQMQPFLADLLEQPQTFQGRFTGHANFEGTIGDFSTWQGDGRYFVDDSRFIGGQVMTRLSTAMNLGREDTEATTMMFGTATMRDGRIAFPDMVIENRRMRMATDGSVAFSGDLDFTVTLEVLTNRLEDVPVVRRVMDAINALKNALVSMRLEGTVDEPTVRTTTLQVDRLPLFQLESRTLERLRESLAEGRERVGEAVRERTETIQPPPQAERRRAGTGSQ